MYPVQTAPWACIVRALTHPESERVREKRRMLLPLQMHIFPPPGKTIFSRRPLCFPLILARLQMVIARHSGRWHECGGGSGRCARGSLFSSPTEARIREKKNCYLLAGVAVVGESFVNSSGRHLRRLSWLHEAQIYDKINEVGIETGGNSESDVCTQTRTTKWWWKKNERALGCWENIVGCARAKCDDSAQATTTFGTPWLLRTHFITWNYL